MDLVLRRGSLLFGIEYKRADAPRLTKSIRSAMEDLILEQVAVAYPGERRYRLADGIDAVPLTHLTRRGRLFRDSE